MDFVLSIYFYHTGNYTALTQSVTLILLLAGVAFKPLVHDDILQWFFLFLTAVNVFAVILVLSYVISRYMPFPLYAHTVLRFVFFASAIFLFKRYLNPLFAKVVKHWQAFFLVSVAFLVNFGYYILGSHDIEKTMANQFVPLLLFIVLGVFMYAAIFYSLKVFSSEYATREENIKIKAQQDILQKEPLCLHSCSCR